MAPSVAWLAHADSSVDPDGMALVERVAVACRSEPVGSDDPDAVSHRHVVSGADGPPDTPSDGEADPASHAPADCHADPDPATGEHADPPRLSDQPSDRVDVRHGRPRR